MSHAGAIDLSDVVVTGVGLVCPLGVGCEAAWQAIGRGESAVRPVPALVEAGLPVPIAGQVLDFEPKQYVKPRKALKVMSRETQLGFAAAELAWDAARLDDQSIDPERLGVLTGSNMFCPDVQEMAAAYHACDDGQRRFDFSRWGRQGLAEMFPLWMLKYLPNMTPCHIGIAHDARGPSNSIVAGDVSAHLALIEAVETLRRGHADVMLAGGVSTTIEMMDLMWHGDVRLSRRIGDPAAACRPFDAQRDGTVGAEAAAIFVLERRDHAEGRGVRPLASWLGYGRRFEAAAESLRPTGQAVRQAAAAALDMAGVAPKELGCVLAHGLGCVHDDRIEAQAICQAAGDVPVVGLKSFYGHCGAGAGAIDLAIGLHALQQGRIPPTRNYETPDPACPANVSAEARRAESPLCLSLSHRLTGQAAALLLRVEPRPDDAEDEPAATLRYQPR
jgi:3-oxoacyl-[acyl-carrier-protein] synthase II